MSRIHRAFPAVIAAMALSACNDPLAPSRAREAASLSIVGTSSTSFLFTSVPKATSDACISGTSTYIVAYGGLLPGCTAPSDTAAAAPAAPADTVGSRLSFP
jgi:hypothetical protein